MISSHEVNAVLATSRLLADHLNEGLWATRLTYRLEEARAAILACIVHQCHTRVLVLVAEDLLLHQRKIRRAQLVSAFIVLIPNACGEAPDHRVDTALRCLRRVALDSFYSPTFALGFDLHEDLLKSALYLTDVLLLRVHVALAILSVTGLAAILLSTVGGRNYKGSLELLLTGEVDVLLRAR